MERSALKPRRFPWYDYSRYTFSLGLSVGERILLSGHSASEYDPGAREMVVKGGMREQVRTAWAKIAAILEAGKRSLADIVRVVEYVTPEGIERYAEATAVRAELFGGNRPAVNTVVVNRLLRSQALIEIEVRRSRPKRRRTRIADGRPRGRRRASRTGSSIFLRSCRSTMRVR